MEGSMGKMKTYLIVWLSGLIAGLILMERWQRTSDLEALAENVEEAGETETASAAMKARADEQPRVTAVIVAGARADAERARQLLTRMTPWRSGPAPSLTRLRRSSQTATTGDTPNGGPL
jgi:hypothetical protein